MLIAHNLATVRYLSHHVLVMYLGQIVEAGAADAVFEKPSHPYTRALLESAGASATSKEQDRRLLLEGEIVAPTDHASYCRFHPRCPLAIDRCRVEAPVLREMDGVAHLAACHLATPSKHGQNAAPPITYQSAEGELRTI